MRARGFYGFAQTVSSFPTARPIEIAGKPSMERAWFSRPATGPALPRGPPPAMRWQTSATALASLFTPLHPCASRVWPCRDLTSRRETQQPCDRIIRALLLGHLLLSLEAPAALFESVCRSSAHKLHPRRQGRTRWVW